MVLVFGAAYSDAPAFTSASAADYLIPFRQKLKLK
jgi:hypothetical protein